MSEIVIVAAARTPQGRLQAALSSFPAPRLGSLAISGALDRGGIAIGHPVGASGARLVVHMAHELSRRGSGTAAVGLCGGGGQGEALVLLR